MYTVASMRPAVNPFSAGRSFTSGSSHAGLPSRRRRALGFRPAPIWQSRLEAGWVHQHMGPFEGASRLRDPYSTAGRCRGTPLRLVLQRRARPAHRLLTDKSQSILNLRTGGSLTVSRSCPTASPLIAESKLGVVASAGPARWAQRPHTRDRVERSFTRALDPCQRQAVGRSSSRLDIREPLAPQSTQDMLLFSSAWTTLATALGNVACG